MLKEEKKAIPTNSGDGIASVEATGLGDPLKPMSYYSQKYLDLDKESNLKYEELQPYQMLGELFCRETKKHQQHP